VENGPDGFGPFGLKKLLDHYLEHVEDDADANTYGPNGGPLHSNAGIRLTGRSLECVASRLRVGSVGWRATG